MRERERSSVLNVSMHFSCNNPCQLQQSSRNNGNSAKLQVNCNQILSNLELGLDLDLDE